jgi:hypothetical protein
MSLTFASLSLKGVTQDAVVSAIRRHLRSHSCYVSRQINGWVTVLDHVLDLGDESDYVETARVICSSCHCPGIVFRILYSSFLFYWLVNDQGELIDRSYVDNFDTATFKERHGLAGDPDRLTAYARPGVTSKQIRQVLAKRKLSPYDNFCLLADLLGLDQSTAALSFGYIEEHSSEWQQQNEESWASFVRIQATSSKTAAGLPQIELPGMVSPDLLFPSVSGPVNLPPHVNFLAITHCALKFDKCPGGMKLTCSCADKESCSQVQSLSRVPLTGVLGFGCMLHGMPLFSCNFSLAICKSDNIKNGVRLTCTSGDKDYCEMIRACSDCITSLLKLGGICYVMVGNTPVCCAGLEHP